LRIGFQQLLTERKKLFPAPIGEEAGKANPDEPAWQDMQHEATQELFGGDRHLALLAAVRVVLPSEADLAVGDGQEAMIGDGDAVRVAGQVVKHMLRPPEGAFGVDHPILTKERPEESMESFLCGEWLETAGKGESALTKGALEAGDKLAAKDAPQYPHRQEEGVARVKPALVVERQTARRDYAMDMRMVASALTIP
jgi:hypothetical protein